MNRDQCPLGSKCPAEKFLHDTAQTIIARGNRQKDETAWLAEHQNDGPCWWGRTPDGEDVFGWTKDSLKALRFARKEDAETYIEETGWNDVTATEHVWVGPPNSQPQT